MTAEHALAGLDFAQQSWTAALQAHWSAPPAPGFAERLMRLANAAEEQSSAFRFADREGLAWTPLANASNGLQPPPELRPDFNRPGPPSCGSASTRPSTTSGSRSRASAASGSPTHSTGCPNVCASCPTPIGRRIRCASNPRAEPPEPATRPDASHAARPGSAVWRPARLAEQERAAPRGSLLVAVRWSSELDAGGALLLRLDR